MRKKQPSKARGNAGDQVVIGFSFASDWSREWHEFSEPITEQSKANAITDYLRDSIEGTRIGGLL